MYEVVISHEAEKYYKKSDRNSKRRINKSINILSENPLTGAHVKRLWGELEGKYRYAIGYLRIVYEVDIQKRIVKIEAIGPRGDVYKR